MKSASFLLRPWLNAGFEYHLAEDPARVAHLRGLTVPHRPQDSPKPFAAGAVLRAKADPSQGRQPHVPPAASVPRQERRAEPSPGDASPSGSPAVIPPEKWSASWQDLWRRHKKPPHPLVLWTYSGLGEDLAGTPDAGRRRVLKSILEGLSHPPGTHMFWPHRLPGEGDAPSVFWSAVDMLAPRVVMVLGSDSRDALGLPRSMRPYAQMMLWGRSVFQLHRPESLASDDALLSSTQAFLASALRFCSARQMLYPR